MRNQTFLVFHFSRSTLPPAHLYRRTSGQFLAAVTAVNFLNHEFQQKPWSKATLSILQESYKNLHYIIQPVNKRYLAKQREDVQIAKLYTAGRILIYSQQKQTVEIITIVLKSWKRTGKLHETDALKLKRSFTNCPLSVSMRSVWWVMEQKLFHAQIQIVPWMVNLTLFQSLMLVSHIHQSNLLLYSVNTSMSDR
jgi:hypothetical protein